MGGYSPPLQNGVHRGTPHPNTLTDAPGPLQGCSVKQMTTKHLHIPSFAAAAVQAALKNAERAADNPTRLMRPASTSPTAPTDRKSTRLNSSHGYISYAVFCL